jgi:hypothetical protein
MGALVILHLMPVAVDILTDTSPIGEKDLHALLGETEWKETDTPPHLLHFDVRQEKLRIIQGKDLLGLDLVPERGSTCRILNSRL